MLASDHVGALEELVILCLLRSEGEILLWLVLKGRHGLHKLALHGEADGDDAVGLDLDGNPRLSESLAEELELAILRFQNHQLPGIHLEALEADERDRRGAVFLINFNKIHFHWVYTSFQS